MPIYAVMPFRDEPGLTLKVLDLLAFEEVDSVLLYDNDSTEETMSIIRKRTSEMDNARVLSAPTMSIYEMWNHGWSTALDKESGEFDIAFLNNDIDFCRGTLAALSTTLRAIGDAWITYPNYDRHTSMGVDESLGVRPTYGTKKDGGMCGHMFMIRGEIAREGFPMVDDGFEWWFGDDQLAWDVREQGGSQYRLLGWPVDHLNEATASNGSNDWTHSAKERDIKRWGLLHG